MQGNKLDEAKRPPLVQNLCETLGSVCRLTKSNARCTVRDSPAHNELIHPGQKLTVIKWERGRGPVNDPNQGARPPDAANPRTGEGAAPVVRWAAWPAGARHCAGRVRQAKAQPKVEEGPPRSSGAL